MASSTAVPRGTTLSGRPGTTRVSASSTASSPGTPVRTKKPWFIRTSGVGVHNVTSYSGPGRPSSGRGSPNSSVATPTSKGLVPSSTITATRWVRTG